MRIALDGCDGVGKSTIAEKLANKFGCNITRLTNGGDRSLNAYIQFLNCENVVHDRTFMTEQIYPKYFNKDCSLSSQELIALYYFIGMMNIKVFILTASIETIQERVNSRGDEFIDDLTKLKNINDDYIAIAEKCGFTVIDTTNKSIDEIVEEIGGNLK